MSRFSAKHVVVATATLLAVAAAALWLWRFVNPLDGPAPSPDQSPPPAKSERIAPAKARRTKTNVATSPTGPRAALVVRVVATSSRAPLVGAAVYVTDGGGDDWRAETDDAGAARFDELAVGNASIHVEMASRMSLDKRVALATGVNKDVEFALDDAVAVEGTVVDADSGAPLASAVVRFALRGGGDRPARESDVTATDSAGRFRFPAAPAAGIVAVDAAAAGHAPAEVTTALPAAGGAVAQVNIRLDPTGTLRGVVRDADGRPVDDAWVHVAWRPAAGAEGADAVTDGNGSFVVRDVRVGDPLRVTAGAPGWADSAPVDLPMFARDELEATADIALRRMATLVVRVLDPSGGVVTSASASFEDSRQLTFTTNSEHALVWKFLVPGTHRLVVRAAGFPDVSRDVTVAEGERVEIAVQLLAGVSISGVVVDEAGAPVVDASVFVVASDWVASPFVPVDLRTHASTAADGSFRMDNVSPGRHGIVVYPAGADTPPQPVDAPAEGVRIVVPATTWVTLRVLTPPGAPGPARVDVTTAGVGQSGDVVFRRSRGIDRSDWLTDAVIRQAVSPKATGLLIRAAGYAPVFVPIRLEAGRTLDLGDVRVDVGVSLNGRVVDGDGRPVSGASVGCSSGSATSHTDGSFVVPHVAHGRCVLHAFAGGRSGAAVIDATEDAAPVMIVARRLGVLHGVVVDAAGAPVKDATVGVNYGFADATDGGITDHASTDEHGAFAVPVAAGRCRVEVGESSAETDVPEGGEASVRVVATKR